VNRLAPAPADDRDGTASGVAAGRYLLPAHAHVVVYDRRERELLTVYDCGAAQKPPSAQLLGNLVRVDAAHERERSPTGYVVSMREPSVLVDQGDGHWVIRARPE
jgi:hypothetical protein